MKFKFITCEKIVIAPPLKKFGTDIGQVTNLIGQGCQTHSVLRATFTYLDFIRATLC